VLASLDATDLAVEIRRLDLYLFLLTLLKREQNRRGWPAGYYDPLARAHRRMKMTNDLHCGFLNDDDISNNMIA
jgi:hypothetical protein